MLIVKKKVSLLDVSHLRAFPLLRTVSDFRMLKLAGSGNSKNLRKIESRVIYSGAEMKMVRIVKFVCVTLLIIRF